MLLRRAGNGIELIAVDAGPGMPRASLPRQRVPAGAGQPVPPAPGSQGPAGEGLAPGAGAGLGVGLAGVERLSRTFDCYSGPRGTVILARIGAPGPFGGDVFRWGGVNVPLAGAGASGDGWAVAAGRGLAAGGLAAGGLAAGGLAAGSLAAMVADGLGHGPDAAVAAAAAIAAFRAGPLADPAASVLRAHEAMLGTRGGVLAACVIGPGRDTMEFAGVGNISGCVLLGRERESLVSRDGTVGTQVRAPRTRSPATAGDRVPSSSWPPTASAATGIRWPTRDSSATTRR